ncbi:hypothetical protein RB195_009824 [Necator americanus]
MEGGERVSCEKVAVCTGSYRTRGRHPSIALKSASAFIAPTRSMIVLVWDYIAPYGWLISFVAFAIYLLYSQFIRPKIEQIRNSRKIIEQKKFDEDLDSRFGQRIAAVRQKQQRDHEHIAEEIKLLAEEASRKRLKDLEERERKKNVLETTLLAHDLNKNRKNSSAAIRSPGELIDQFISSKPIVVFSKTWCPFSRKAKAALATFRLSSRHFEYIELDERTDLPGDAIQDELERRYGSRSVPKVFIAGKFIGGVDDTVRLLHNGELEVMVNAALGIN